MDLATETEGESGGGGLIYALPQFDPQHILHCIFHLAYTKGDGLSGSGLHFTRADFMEFGIDEIDQLLEMLGEQRAMEAKAIKK